jgi:hypothetical protein
LNGQIEILEEESARLTFPQGVPSRREATLTT